MFLKTLSACLKVLASSWRDSSGIGSNCYYSRGHKFNSQHLSQTAPAPGGPNDPVICEHLHKCDIRTYSHTHAHKHKLKKKQIFLKVLIVLNSYTCILFSTCICGIHTYIPVRALNLQIRHSKRLVP